MLALVGMSVDWAALAVPRYVKWSAPLVADVPAGVVTVTSTVPAAPAGALAVIVVELPTKTLVALLAPNFTLEAPVRFVPVSVTAVPPVVGPLFGLTPVTVGVPKMTTGVAEGCGTVSLDVVTLKVLPP